MLIRSMAKDKAIVISTHILEEVDAVCTRVAVIAKGRIVFDGTPAALEMRSKTHNAVAIRLRTARAGELRESLSSAAFTARVDLVGEADGFANLLVLPKDGRSIIAEVSEFVRTRGFPIEEVQVERSRLDDVFRDLTLRT
jgi:ABC-2 type transport system ATP-binding protein